MLRLAGFKRIAGAIPWSLSACVEPAPAQSLASRHFKFRQRGVIPAAMLAAAGHRPVEVSDASGRIITLRKPAPLARLDFAKAAGGAEINQLYLAEVMHLPFVAAIDGMAVASPASDGELRALYARLGDDGNDAAQLGVLEHFMPPPVAEAEAELKNG